MDTISLTGSGLLLSVPTADDADAIFRACQDPAIQEWVTVPSPYSPADASGFLTHVVGPGWETGREVTWAIRDDERPDRDLLGMVGLHGVEHGSAEIGFWVSPWARGEGVITRALPLVLDHAFSPEGLDLVRVTWMAFVGNWPSRRVAWRCGFQVEGTLRQHGLQRGVRRDAWVGSLLRGEPRRPAEDWPQDAPVLIV